MWHARTHTHTHTHTHTFTEIFRILAFQSRIYFSKSFLYANAQSLYKKIVKEYMYFNKTKGFYITVREFYTVVMRCLYKIWNIVEPHRNLSIFEFHSVVKHRTSESKIIGKGSHWARRRNFGPKESARLSRILYILYPYLGIYFLGAPLLVQTIRCVSFLTFDWRVKPCSYSASLFFRL